ncbi:hypothetical protein [Reyranella sp.]|uniref:hypothetical protein n=1 Tax=Reyranella sp. TaxID=1929291 RepID=UPI00272FCA09|nr:hypothetical protein [Reyranella sp.]MDP2372553.1 hypothetical protein [Reyranella sp.]
MIDWRIAPVVAVALLVLFGPTALAQSDELADYSGRPADHSGRHGDGHAQMHDKYKLWHPPTNPGTSCCDNSDCRPTRAFVDGDGHWRAWNGALWLQVPQDRVLPPNHAGDGRSHLCEKEQFIYCFTPGEIRG